MTVTGPASAVYTNDLIFYGINVVNLGPNTASNVFLVNMLPPGMGFKITRLQTRFPPFKEATSFSISGN